LMKKTKLFSLAFALGCIITTAQSQNLASWDFENNATLLTASAYDVSLASAPVITFNSMTSSGQSSPGGSGCSANGWRTTNHSQSATIDLNYYFEFTLTPNSGYAISVSGISFYGRGNGTRPQDFAIRTSDDGYAANIASGTGVFSGSACVATNGTFSTPVQTTDAVTFRIYLFNAGNGAGNLDILTLGFTGFGNILPVQLLSFTGSSKASSNLLQWTVSKEENFSHYIVERSIDGRSYSPIGKISGAGKGNYEFVDTKPGAKNLYRLQMVDKDGRQNATKILMVANKPKVIIANIIPTLVHGNATLRVASEKPTTVSLYAFDVSGKRTPLGNHSLSGGEQQIPLKLSALAAGVYQLSIVSASGQTETVRFVKQ